MKFNKKWLEEWIPCSDMGSKALARTLTMAGLEVDAVEPASTIFSSVVIGEIISTDQHPNADRLRVCQISGHPDGHIRQVVCGASNARPGIKVPFALVGAKLPGELNIQQTKLREIDSHGMLCARQELGFSEPTNGLWELPQDAPTGTDIRSWLQLDDEVIEVDLTPNRGDCLSLLGMSRELACLTDTTSTPLSVTTIPALHDSIFPIKISQPDHCPTYAGRVIHNIKPGCTSPVWLTEKLRHCGIRSIDPVVDVTNYVMLELGQPMHAFDLDTLQGGIDIRLARAGEQLELLDGQQVCLDEQTLLIADAQKPLAIAGIMGGKPSSVTSQTCNLFLESAWFDPIKIAGKARHYGLHTDSSHRFERGVDYSLQTTAIERATSLLIEIVGGEPGPVQHITRQEHLPARQPVSLRRTRLDQQLGVILPDEIVIGILTRLGFSPKKEAADWIITAPPWRFDITIEQDLIEEVARVYGYNRLPTRCLHASLEISMSTETKRPLDKLNELMVARGYREVITYSFISRELQELFSSGSASVSLINPIASDMGDMRLSLMPGLVSTLQQNLNRQHTRARLFESGLRFQMIDGKLQQQPTLAGLAYGNLLPEGWSQATRPTDYFDLKGDVEALLTRTGRRPDFRFEAGHHPALHPGQTAIILDEGLPIGFIGTLHPEIQRKLDLPQSAFLFELDRNALARDNKPAFSPVSRFPEVRRDIAVVVDRLVPSQSLVDSIFASGSDTLKNVTIFDVYCGEHIDPHRKSVALGLTFQHASRTLGESEIVEQLEAIVAELAAKHGAQLRN